MKNAKTFISPFFEIPILFWFKILTSQFNVFQNLGLLALMAADNRSPE